MIRTKFKREKPEKLERKYSKKEIEKLLTPKQRIFCHEYIREWNCTKAALVAGYSKDTAGNIGSENLKKPYLRQYIEYIKENIEQEVGISKIGLLKELKNIAYGNVGDLYGKDWITREELNKLRKERPHLIKAIQEVSTKVQRIVLNKELVDVEYVKIKLYDKQKAIGEIFKAMGWYSPDKVEIEAAFTSTVDVSTYTEEEKKVLLKLARKNEYRD